MSPVVKKVDLTDYIAEAQNQTAADQSRDQGREDFAQGSHDLLNGLLVGLGCGLHRILAHSLDARIGSKLVVKYAHIISDDDLILAGLGKGPLDTGDFLNGLLVRLFRIHQYEPHPGHTVGYRLDVFLAADIGQKFFDLFLIFPHNRLSILDFICVLV